MKLSLQMATMIGLHRLWLLAISSTSQQTDIKGNDWHGCTAWPSHKQHSHLAYKLMLVTICWILQISTFQLVIALYFIETSRNSNNFHFYPWNYFHKDVTENPHINHFSILTIPFYRTLYKIFFKKQGEKGTMYLTVMLNCHIHLVFTQVLIS